MEDLLDELFNFWTRMFKRFREKDDAGWEGWEDIGEKEFVRRAISNAKARDYVMQESNPSREQSLKYVENRV